MKEDQVEIATEPIDNQVVDFNEGSNFPCEVDNGVHLQYDKVVGFHEDVYGEKVLCDKVKISNIECGVKAIPDEFGFESKKCDPVLDNQTQIENHPNRDFDLLKDRGGETIGFHQIGAYILKTEDENRVHDGLHSLLQSSSDVFDRGKIKFELVQEWVVGCHGEEVTEVTMNKPSGMEWAVVGLSLSGIPNFVWDPGDGKKSKKIMGLCWVHSHKCRKFIMIFYPGGLTWVDKQDGSFFVILVFDPGGVRIEDNSF